MSLHSSVPKIMVFRPTLEEMRDFPAYVTHMESMGAHKAGIAKIIPPKEFVAAYDYDNINEKVIPAPIQQEVMGHQGLYTQYNIQKKPLTFPEFKKLANSSRYATPPHFDYEDLERKYWKNITYNPPIYAADISGSLYSKGCDIWNINKLNTLLDVIEEEQGVKIEGVNTAYLYFGMWKTTFAWHTEDMDLYSINYLHFGAPKSWYGIPPEHAKRLERLASGFFPQSFQICPNFLRHKMTLISPQILRKYSIPFDKITQETGEFMITFPYGYHAGYNHGFNCAESTNFASLRWIDFGKRAKCCSCQRDSVKINMDPFIKIFQPDRYQAWKEGKDIVYIEDLDKPSAGVQAHNLLTNTGLSTSRDLKQVERLKTRRQPLHKKDGRRAKAGTTSHVKRGQKDEDSLKAGDVLAVGSPTVTIPVVKMDMISASVPPSPERSNMDRGDGNLSEKAGSKVAFDDGEAPHIDVPPSMSCQGDSQISTPKPKKRKKSSKKDSSKEKRSRSGDDEAASQTKAHSKKKRSKLKEGSQPGPKDKNTNLAVSPDTRPEVSAQQGVPGQDAPLVALPQDDDIAPGGAGKSTASSEKTEKCGLLLERELAEQKRRMKLKKIAMLKKKDKVKFVHASASGSLGTDGEPSKAATNANKLGKPAKRKGEVKSAIGKNETSSSTVTVTSETVATIRKTSGRESGKESDKPMVCQTKAISRDGKQTASASRSRPGGNGPSKRGKHDFTEQEFATMKAWARSMNGLWITQPHSYDMEFAYNMSIADQWPGCCVCMLFHNEKADSAATVHSNSDNQRRPVLIPEICFTATSQKDIPDCINEVVNPDGRSPILNCDMCKIAVHASCYGFTGDKNDTWKCRRCEQQDYLAECCLCNLRGGALKPTTNGRWAHIVCAMAIPEVRFEDVPTREPINITQISPARLKLKCFFCRPFIKVNNKHGGLIQCSIGRCALAFHVTCAQAAGVIMEPWDWPHTVYATCLRHPYPDGSKDSSRDCPLRDVATGEMVIAKHKNSRYYRSEVTGYHQQVFYHVKFDDSSFSQNLFPEDIESHDCMTNGPPRGGSEVRVRWTDRRVYSGTFIDSKTVKMYDVEFEDSSESRVNREDLYLEDEPLPKKVRTRLSTASDMRHENFLDSEVVTDRHRHVYSLYASSAEALGGTVADVGQSGTNVVAVPSRHTTQQQPELVDSPTDRTIGVSAVEDGNHTIAGCDANRSPPRPGQSIPTAGAIRPSTLLDATSQPRPSTMIQSAELPANQSAERWEHHSPKRSGSHVPPLVASSLPGKGSTGLFVQSSSSSAAVNPASVDSFSQLPQRFVSQFPKQLSNRPRECFAVQPQECLAGQVVTQPLGYFPYQPLARFTSWPQRHSTDHPPDCSANQPLASLVSQPVLTSQYPTLQWSTAGKQNPISSQDDRGSRADARGEAVANSAADPRPSPRRNEQWRRHTDS